MKIFDITVAITPETPVYEGDPAIEFDVCHAISRGDAANVSKLMCGVHSGTHIDAPCHFIEGAERAHEIDLQKCLGKCLVVEIPADADSVTLEHVRQAGLENAERVLFKTRNSTFWNNLGQGFRKDFVYIEPEAARELVRLDIKLVGIDYLSVEKFGSTDFGTHLALLGAKVVIIEGVDLREVSAGEYEIICLPLKYIGGKGDGAPSRTILRKSVK